MIQKNYKKYAALFMAAAMVLTPAVPAFAASSADTTNNTATGNDLANADIIDESRTGSITIKKYDMTAAAAAGDYQEGYYKATGEVDNHVEGALSDYAIEGVQFSYLRVGDVETHSVNQGTTTSVELVYEIPTDLAAILELDPADAVDMTSKGGTEAEPCDRTGVYHYTSQQLSDALDALLKKDNVAAKNALESYLYDYGTMDSTIDQTLKSGVVHLPRTNGFGVTSAAGLELGLYLLVETEVPENVVETVNPWFVQLPFTNTSAQVVNEDGFTYDVNGEHNPDGVTNSAAAEGTDAHVSGGERWLYDMTCYPKNQTGNPTLDKSVRNAYSNTVSAEPDAVSGTDKNGTVHSGTNYVSGKTSESLVVYHQDPNADNTKDTDDAAYVANRGGYTTDGTSAGKILFADGTLVDGAGYSTDFAYRDTTTASEGDVLDYILVSRLPHISSQATFLSEYTFTDVLSRGITYNEDVKIAFYDNAVDANANNTRNAVVFWKISEEGNYSQKYAMVSVTDGMSGEKKGDGSTRLTVSLTEAGLQVINGTGTNNPAGNDPASAEYLNGLSDYYMVVYYTATVNSDASVVLGDDGNPNHVNLVWSRTSDGYSNMLEDRNYVYAYALDLTKTFSDSKGNFDHVQFKLYNGTDAYYVVAKESAEEDGVYYVTGKTTDESKGTTFIPAANDAGSAGMRQGTPGKLVINGLEADQYQLTEVATDDGYHLLKGQIVIDITATDREVIASVAGVTGLDADAVQNIVGHYHGGIYDENGNRIDSQLDEVVKEYDEDGNQIHVGGVREDTPNGNEIGGTDLYVGKILSASSTVDGIPANMASMEYTLMDKDGKDVDETSANAAVLMTVNNTKGFPLPRTGGNGLYVVTVLGVLAVAGGCWLVTRKKKTEECR